MASYTSNLFLAYFSPLYKPFMIVDTFVLNSVVSIVMFSPPRKRGLLLRGKLNFLRGITCVFFFNLTVRFFF